MIEAMHNALERDPELIIVFFAMAGGFLIAIIAIVFSYVAAMVRSTHRERSRREIAAYIAEGSMTPSEGQALMASGESKT